MAADLLCYYNKHVKKHSCLHITLEFTKALHKNKMYAIMYTALKSNVYECVYVNTMSTILLKLLLLVAVREYNQPEEYKKKLFQKGNSVNVQYVYNFKLCICIGKVNTCILCSKHFLYLPFHYSKFNSEKEKK